MNHPSELPHGYPRQEPEWPEDDLVLTDQFEPHDERPEYAVIYALVCVAVVFVIALALVLAS